MKLKQAHSSKYQLNHKKSLNIKSPDRCDMIAGSLFYSPFYVTCSDFLMQKWT